MEEELEYDVDFYNNLEIFDTYLESAKKAYKIMEAEHLHSLLYHKTPIYKPDEIKAICGMIDHINKIKDCYGNVDTYLDMQEDFVYLIQLLALCICNCYKKGMKIDTIEFTNIITNYYVCKSKDNGENFEFLRYFDDDGNIILERCFQLKYYIKDALTKLAKTFKSALDYDLTDQILVSKDDLIEADRLFEEKREKQRKEKPAPKTVISKERKEVRKTKNIDYSIPKYKELRQVLDTNTDTIRFNCGKTFEEIKEILTKFGITDLDKYIKQYKKQMENNRINKLERVLGKKLWADLQKKLKNPDIDETIKEEFNNYYKSDDFLNAVDSEVRIALTNIYRKLSSPNRIITNFIIFPTEDFIENQKQKFYNSRTHLTAENAMRKINTQLQRLQSESIDSIKAKDSDAFHSIIFLKDKIKDLKALRYGHMKSKVCFFQISVHEKNQKELFGTNNNGRILLVFGLSHVEIENEDDFYNNQSSYALENLDSILEINNIFTKPFTDETRRKAFDLIKSGETMLNDFTDENTAAKVI